MTDVDEETSICDWLIAVSDEMTEKAVPVDDRSVMLTGDEPRLLLIELANLNAKAGKAEFARQLRNVIAMGNPASFIAQNEFRVGDMLVRAAVN